MWERFCDGLDSLRTHHEDTDMVQAHVEALINLFEDMVRFLNSKHMTDVFERVQACRPPRAPRGGRPAAEVEGEAKMSRNESEVGAADVDATHAEDIIASVTAMAAKLSGLDPACGFREVKDMLTAFEFTCEAAYLESRECLHIVKLLISGPALGSVDITMRSDVVFSQMLTGLVTAFYDQLDLRVRENDRFYGYQLLELGFLLHMNSLLSTQGDEQGMIEDVSAAMGLMRRVKITLSHVSGDDPDPVISGSRYDYTVDIGVSAKLLQHMPEKLRCGGPISVQPVFFSQGVNEKQTIANHVGDNTTQFDLNSTNFKSLRVYATSFCDLYVKHHGESPEMVGEIKDKLKLHYDEIHARKAKNIDILLLAEELTASMNAGRIICCKSGKVRLIF